MVSKFELQKLYKYFLSYLLLSSVDLFFLLNFIYKFQVLFFPHWASLKDPEIPKKGKIFFTISDNNDREENQDSDSWSEEEEESSSQLSSAQDTMFTPPNFIEDDESDAVYSFAPEQHNTPPSIFQDNDSEELAFINIFCGERRPNNTSRKVPV